MSEDLIGVFTGLAVKARREGLLALEKEAEEISDPFFAKGLYLMVDAVDPDTIREILEGEIGSIEERHQMGQSVFKCWARMAPVFGMIGTLVGLVQMLASLGDPSALGPGMSVALLSTLYGILLANLVLNPVAGKLALRSIEEVKIKKVILEGVISIQSGMNPTLLEEKLYSLLPPYRRDSGRTEVAADAPI